MGHDEKILNLLRGPTVCSIWCDNFTRWYYTAVVRTNIDIMRTTNDVTAMAIIPSRAVVAPSTFRTVRTPMGNKILPCIDANSMFNQTVVDRCIADLTKRGKALFRPTHYDHYCMHSFCHTKYIDNSPLKPPLGPGEQDRMRLVPYGMLPMGTSSTIELTKTFDYLQDPRERGAR